MTENLNPVATAEQADTKKIDFIKVIQVGLTRWYWILGSLLLTFIIAFIYLRYTPKTYQTSATIRLEEKKSPLSSLLSNSNADESSDPLQTESFIIKSKALLARSLVKLNYQVSFYKKGNFLVAETYPFQPFQIVIESIDTLNGSYPLFTIHNLPGNKIHLNYRVGDKTIDQTTNFNETIHLGDLKFKIVNSAVGVNDSYTFRFNSVNSLLGRVSHIQISEVAKGSNILQVSLSDHNPYFASDFLNVLIQEYQFFDRDQKALSATHTIDFINEQLNELAKKVESSQNALANYKKGNKIVDFSTASTNNLSQLTNYESQKSALKIQELAMQQLEKQVTEHKGQITYNFNVEEASNSLLSSLIGKYNSIVSELMDKSNYYNNHSEVITTLNKDLLETQKSIINNIHLNLDRIHSTINYLDKIIGGYNNNISALPDVEKNIFGLERNFNINEKVFTFLMEKKLETQVNRASIIPGSSIVETAHPNFVPIDPISKSVYFYAFVLGMILPIVSIIAVRFLNNNINNIEDIELAAQTPVLGVIRSYPYKMDPHNRLIITSPQTKTIFSESVRAVRTSLSFVATDKACKIISVTSEISGEGKSFVSLNLANTLSLIEKKVIIISTDLRKRRLHKTFGVSLDVGLSTYLAGQSELSEVLFKSENPNLDFIASGPISPNPAELLHSKKMNDLLAFLKTKYDYILLDNAPIGLVADALPIIRQSDINLFIVRTGISKKSAITLVDALKRDLRLNNIYIILNGYYDNKLFRSFYASTTLQGSSYSGYYGKYNYYNSGYYDDEERGSFWWKFWEKNKSDNS